MLLMKSARRAVGVWVSLNRRWLRSTTSCRRPRSIAEPAQVATPLTWPRSTTPVKRHRLGEPLIVDRQHQDDIVAHEGEPLCQFGNSPPSTSWPLRGASYRQPFMHNLRVIGTVTTGDDVLTTHLPTIFVRCLRRAVCGSPTRTTQTVARIVQVVHGSSRRRLLQCHRSPPLFTEQSRRFPRRSRRDPRCLLHCWRHPESLMHAAEVVVHEV